MKRRAPWLVLGVLLLALGAWLMPSIQPGGGRHAIDEPRLEFPRYATERDWARMQKRRTLPPLPVSKSDAGDAPSTPGSKRDPLLVALPPRGDLLVFEVSAFLKSPIGRMMTDCLSERGEVPTLQDDGFDLSSFERVAVGNPSDDHRLVAISGPIAKGMLPKVHLDQQPKPYGDRATIYTAEQHDNREVLAVWNDELMLVSDDLAEIHAAIDRLEGRNQERSTFPPENAYGEMYGRLSAKAALELLPVALQEKIPETDLNVELHADSSRDVLLVADAYGSDPNGIDIGKTLAAALGAQRFAAAAEGDHELSELLDAFSVERSADGFQLQAAFTEDFVANALGQCAQRARKRAPQPEPQVTAGAGG